MVIADENINIKIIESIRSIGINVVSVSEEYPGISDEDIIKLSLMPSRIILTEDKDFGEWVFAHNAKNVSVIFLRYHHKDLLKINSALLSLLKHDFENLFGKFVTITISKVRIRAII